MVLQWESIQFYSKMVETPLMKPEKMDNFFRHRKYIFYQLFFTTPTQNFTRIPKIVLRNSCEHFKEMKNTKEFFLYYMLISDPIRSQLGTSFV